MTGGHAVLRKVKRRNSLPRYAFDRAQTDAVVVDVGGFPSKWQKDK